MKGKLYKKENPIDITRCVKTLNLKRDFSTLLEKSDFLCVNEKEDSDLLSKFDLYIIWWKWKFLLLRWLLKGEKAAWGRKKSEFNNKSLSPSLLLPSVDVIAKTIITFFRLIMKRRRKFPLDQKWLYRLFNRSLDPRVRSQVCHRNALLHEGQLCWQTPACIFLSLSLQFNFQTLFNLIRFSLDFFYYFLICTSSSEKCFSLNAITASVKWKFVFFRCSLCCLLRFFGWVKKKKATTGYKLQDYRARDSFKCCWNFIGKAKETLWTREMERLKVQDGRKHF